MEVLTLEERAKVLVVRLVFLSPSWPYTIKRITELLNGAFPKHIDELLVLVTATERNLELQKKGTIP